MIRLSLVYLQDILFRSSSINHIVYYSKKTQQMKTLNWHHYQKGWTRLTDKKISDITCRDRNHFLGQCGRYKNINVNLNDTSVIIDRCDENKQLTKNSLGLATNSKLIKFLCNHSNCLSVHLENWEYCVNLMCNSNLLWSLWCSSFCIHVLL